MKSAKNRDGQIAATVTRISTAGLRVTGARQSIIEILIDAKTPLSVDELEAKSSGRFDLVTVYRTMEVFVDKGIVDRILLEDGKSLFALADAHEHSHHIICRECHKTERIEFCMGGELERYASSRGFSNLSHTIEVFGVCVSCKKSAKAELCE